MFSLEEGPGVLFKALAVFALRSINLSKVSFEEKLCTIISSSFENTNTRRNFRSFLDRKSSAETKTAKSS